MSMLRSNRVWIIFDVGDFNFDVIYIVGVRDRKYDCQNIIKEGKSS